MGCATYLYSNSFLLNNIYSLLRSFWKQKNHIFYILLSPRIHSMICYVHADPLASWLLLTTPSSLHFVGTSSSFLCFHCICSIISSLPALLFLDLFYSSSSTSQSSLDPRLSPVTQESKLKLTFKIQCHVTSLRHILFYSISTQQ